MRAPVAAPAAARVARTNNNSRTSTKNGLGATATGTKQQQQQLVTQKKAQAKQALNAVITSPIPANIDAAGFNRLPGLHFLTLTIDTAVPLRLVRTQPDGGKVLRLHNRRGFRAVYSHPEDTTPESIAMGAVDIINGDVRTKLFHAAGTDLMLSLVNVPLEKAHAAPDLLATQSKDAPHGNLSFQLKGSGAEETFQRGLTREQAAYINMFPLEAGKKIEDQAYPTAKNPDVMHVTVPSEVMYFYNKIAPTPITGCDREGTEYGETPHVKEAMKMATKARQVPAVLSCFFLSWC